MGEAREQPSAASSQGPDDRALAYLRVSTFQQEEQGQNLEGQLDEVREYCDRAGYELAGDDVYRDIVSGAMRDRAGYYDLLSRVEDGEADVIVAYAVDRLGRNTLDTGWLMAKAKEFGVRIETVAEGGRDFTGDPSSELVFDILSSVAKYERSAIMQKMTRGKKKGLERGCWVTSKAPVGYDSEGPRGNKVLVPNEWSEYIPVIYERFLEGAAFNELARWLRNEEVGGLGWTEGTHVKNVLTNPVYLGKLGYNGDVFEGQHEALVGQAVWDRAQEKVREREAKYHVDEEWECPNPECDFTTTAKVWIARHPKECPEG